MKFAWYNEPPAWSEDGGTLRVTTGPGTDFWCRTHYGFVRDNGHFRHVMAKGDFSASVVVEAAYSHLYDQAGLMVRVDAANWLKTGIEFTDGALHFSVVVTRDGYSDWSQCRLAEAEGQPLALRLTRHAEALRVQYRLPGGHWIAARLAMLSMGERVAVGPMCCTPERQGLQVAFRDFAVGPPIARDLHADA
jgi:regulation of enolase protein 1 (concanavalin A-like superfamily)